MDRVDSKVHTRSRFLVWWLRALNGYSVKKVTWRPRLSIFGRVRYDHTYTLGPPEQDDPPSSIGFNA